MAGSTGSAAKDARTPSRRDAILGALTLAAGALLVTRPEPAAAANAQALTVGALHTGTSGTVFWRTETGAIGPVFSQAMIAGPNTLGSHRALEGEVYGPAGAAAAGVRGYAGSAGQFGVIAESPRPG